MIDNCLAVTELLLGDFAESKLRDGEELAAEAASIWARWDFLFDQVPVACLELDSGGIIVRANGRASLLLNLSARHLENRRLLYFVDDRSRFVSLLHEANGQSAPARGRLRIRPRDRSIFEVETILVREPHTSPPACLCFLSEATRSPTGRERPKRTLTTTEGAEAAKAADPPGEVSQPRLARVADL